MRVILGFFFEFDGIAWRFEFGVVWFFTLLFKNPSFLFCLTALLTSQFTQNQTSTYRETDFFGLFSESCFSSAEEAINFWSGMGSLLVNSINFSTKLLQLTTNEKWQG
jgi:hypothetical protein